MTGVKSVGIADFSRAGIDVSPLFSDQLKDFANVVVNSIVDASNRNGPFESEAASRLRSAFTDIFLSSGRYAVIDLGDSRNADNGKSSRTADAVVSGNLVKCQAEEDEGEESQTSKEGIVTKVPVFTRTVHLEFDYRVEDASTGRMLGQKNKKSDQTSTRKGPNARRDVQSRSDLLKQAIDSLVPEIRRELIPWVDTRYVALERDKNNDGMMRAEREAKNGNYAAARSDYAAIYLETRLFGAGYNAAVLQFYLGDRTGAIAAMKALADSTGENKALAEYQRMLKDMSDEWAAALIGNG